MDEINKELNKQARFYRIIYSLIVPILRLLFPFSVIGRENIPEGAAIICAPHSSMIDPLLIAAAFGKKRHIFFMAKKELFSVPLIGGIIRRVGAFPVDRSTNDIQSVRTAMRCLRSGNKVCIFPEGTRVATDDAVAAKTGAVRLASKMKTPVSPVYIPRKKRLFRRMRVIVGEPVTFERLDGSDCAAEAERLMEMIKSLGTECTA